MTTVGMLFQDFANAVSIHGFAYAGNPDLVGNWMLRKIFLIITLTFLTLASILLWNTFQDWEANPVQVAIDNPVVPIETLPFPSVTVCPRDGSNSQLERWTLFSDVVNNLDPLKLDEILAGTVNMRRLFTQGILDKSRESYQFPDNAEDFKTELFYLLKQDKRRRLVTFMSTYVSYGLQMIQDKNASAEEYQVVLQKAEEEIWQAVGPIPTSFNLDQALVNATVILRALIPKEYIRPKWSLMRSYKSCFDSSDCLTLLKDSFRIWMTFDQWFSWNQDLPFGTYFGMVARELHKSWRHSRKSSKIMSMASSNVNDIDKEWSYMTTLMSSWTTKIWSNLSLPLMDLVSLLTASRKPIGYYNYWSDTPLILNINGSELNCTLTEFQTNFKRAMAKDKNKEAYMKYDCFNLLTKLGLSDNPEALSWILKLMSLSSVHGNGFQYRNVSKYLDPILKNIDGLAGVNNIDHSLAWANTFVYCSFGEDLIGILESDSIGDSLDCKKLLSPQLTSSGICYSFNAQHPGKLFRPSQYLDTFRDTYDLEPEASALSRIRMATGFGPGSSFGLVLDSKQRFQPKTEYGDHGNKQKKFSLHVGTAENVFDTARLSTEVLPGYKTTYIVSMEETSASESLSSLSLNQRKCRFSHENDGIELFKDYSQVGCQFECALIRSEATCSCIPWDFPRTEGAFSSRICGMYGSNCFHDMMANTTNYNCDSCLPDCNEISLKYAGDREILKLDPELCSYAPFSLATAQPRSLVKLVQNLAFLEQGKPVSKSDKELCQRILDSDIAIVTVQLESKSFQKWSRSPRVSFFDKLSYIGGMMGLFAGVSLLSFCELIFWLGKLFFSRFGARK